VRVASPQAEKLAALMRERGARVAGAGRGEAMTVTGLDRDGIGELAAAHGVVPHELVDERPSLEDAFFELTDSEGSGPR
jgi:ABC-2 type transport system ATP-binding protein